MSIRRRQATADNGLPIGKTDRFEGGKLFPCGLGTQSNETRFNSILSVKEIRSGFLGLVNEYGISTFETPYVTHENATIFGGKIGGNRNCDEAYRVYLNAAIHARERLTYGGCQYSRCDVSKALGTGIVFLPLSNPDGVAYDQATNECWRKNRNPAGAVDLNRNFDFLWNLTQFTPSVAPNVASDDPTKQTYHGVAPFSKPESKSIKWVMDTFNKVRWFMDIHSFAGVVLYSWGSDENQSKNKDMNFMNRDYDNARGLMPDSPEEGLVYSEYIPAQDWSEVVFAGMRTGNAMDGATGRHYKVTQAAYLYPTSGASDDYAYSRHFADPTLNRINGFTVEFGFGNDNASCPFYPTQEQYSLNILETNSGFMEFLLAAADIGLGDTTSC
ncbi:zinc carboxypeptidase [Microdochium bolleyi]|uniref:Zinc carboxypeptidase n=1 Tax=Microdochium bolleyi TaxID=196109 RepID=A0A136JF83_9PEZI|nr:zinc carboxypeptidase [Microdochium bolleyi]